MKNTFQTEKMDKNVYVVRIEFQTGKSRAKYCRWQGHKLFRESTFRRPHLLRPQATFLTAIETYLLQPWNHICYSLGTTSVTALAHVFKSHSHVTVTASSPHMLHQQGQICYKQTKKAESWPNTRPDLLQPKCYISIKKKATNITPPKLHFLQA